ncbi:MAG: hypothetical protein LBU20_01240 [Candidatus Nomurabacteria bacterium]|jgi:hypothetical protein|nr:hypothetical protein [Candidatus Nomurabacteria bacterium]
MKQENKGSSLRQEFAGAIAGIGFNADSVIVETDDALRTVTGAVTKSWWLRNTPITIVVRGVENNVFYIAYKRKLRKFSTSQDSWAARELLGIFKFNQRWFNFLLNIVLKDARKAAIKKRREEQNEKVRVARLECKYEVRRLRNLS